MPGRMQSIKHRLSQQGSSIPVDTSTASHRSTSPNEDIAILSAHESVLLIHARQRITLLQMTAPVTAAVADAVANAVAAADALELQLLAI